MVAWELVTKITRHNVVVASLLVTVAGLLPDLADVAVGYAGLVLLPAAEAKVLRQSSLDGCELRLKRGFFVSPHELAEKMVAAAWKARTGQEIPARLTYFFRPQRVGLTYQQPWNEALDSGLHGQLPGSLLFQMTSCLELIAVQRNSDGSPVAKDIASAVSMVNSLALVVRYETLFAADASGDFLVWYFVRNPAILARAVARQPPPAVWQLRRILLGATSSALQREDAAAASLLRPMVLANSIEWNTLPQKHTQMCCHKCRYIGTTTIYTDHSPLSLDDSSLCADCLLAFVRLAGRAEPLPTTS